MKNLNIQLYNPKTGESITLPINPESTDIPIEKDIRTYNILGFGEVPVRGNRQLQRINLAGLLPDKDTRLALLASLIRKLEYKPYSLEETRQMLNEWCENGDVIRFIISNKLNKEFLVERYTATVKEYTTDQDFNFDLVEYRMPSKTPAVLSNISGESKLVQLKTRLMNKYIPAQFVGKEGQTIYKLAKLTYGGRFKELADKNGITNQNLSIAGDIVEMLPL